MVKLTRKIENTMLKLDLFGESVKFSIDGEDSHKSILGSIVSLGIFATILAFGTKKFINCINY